MLSGEERIRYIDDLARDKELKSFKIGQPPHYLDYPDICLYYALRGLRAEFRSGQISGEQGQLAKVKIIGAFRQWQNEVELMRKCWKFNQERIKNESKKAKNNDE